MWVRGLKVIITTVSGQKYELGLFAGLSVCILTLQLLSSSAVKIMTPHFFPGIPLRAKGEKERMKHDINNKSAKHMSFIVINYYCDR